MYRTFALLATLLFPFIASSNDGTFLTKEQAVAALAGKALTLTRATYGNLVRWDFRNDGDIFANNRSSARKDSGTWAIQDDDSVCIKWRGASNDSCSFYFIDGTQLMRTGQRSAQAIAKAVAMTPE